MPIRASRWPPLPYRGPLAHPRLALCPLHRSRQIREAGRRWRPSCCVRRAPVRASTATPRGHPGRFGCLLVDLRAVVCGALRGAAAIARESVPRACSSGNVRVANVAGGWTNKALAVPDASMAMELGERHARPSSLADWLPLSGPLAQQPSWNAARARDGPAELSRASRSSGPADPTVPHRALRPSGRGRRAPTPRRSLTGPGSTGRPSTFPRGTRAASSWPIRRTI